MNKKSKTKEFTVKWEIQVSATSKKDAAIIAAAIMRDRRSTATVMSVVEFDNTADEPEEFDLSEDRSEKIRYIKKVLNDWGNTSCCELELDHSPCLTSTGNGGGNVCELVEQFDVEGVETIVYDDDIELEYNNYKYDELEDDIIDEIFNIMEQYETEQEKLKESCEN
jgi:hypothetical protein